MYDTIFDLLKIGQDILKKFSIESYVIDAELILSFVLKIDRLALYFCKNTIINEKKIKLFFDLIDRRKKHEPIAQIIGYKEFWNNGFFVNKSTLIPRPETEIILEEIIKLFTNKNEKLYFADLGAGTGCIGLSLLQEYKNSRCMFIEKSKMATECIKKNAKNLDLTNRSIIINNSWNKINIKKKFDFIVSNPPYIPKSLINKIMIDVVKFEPHQALFAKNHGVKCYQEILELSKNFLKKNGYLIFEIDHNWKKINIPNTYKILKVTNDLLNLPRSLLLQFTPN